MDDYQPKFDIEELEEYAMNVHRKYGNCAQAVTKAVMDFFGIVDDKLFRSMSGVGGGIATMYGPCSALTGGIVMLGYKYGRGLEDLKAEDGGKSILLERNDFMGKFYKWFELKFGCVNCKDLRKSWIGVDLDFRIPWQSEMAEQLGLHEEGCFIVVGKTAKKVAEIMIDEDEINRLINKKHKAVVVKSDNC